MYNNHLRDRKAKKVVVVETEVIDPYCPSHLLTRVVIVELLDLDWGAGGWGSWGACYFPENFNLRSSIPFFPEKKKGMRDRRLDLFYPDVYFKGYTASLIGIGNSPMENEKTMQGWVIALKSAIKKDHDHERFLEIKDERIANIPVRIYKPKNIDAGKKLTGLVFLHGGGWTIGTVGRLSIILQINEY